MSSSGLESFRVEPRPVLLELRSADALAQRLARVPTEDRVRGYLLQSAMEQVRLNGSDEAVRRCLAASGVESPVAFFKYPLSSLLRLLYQAAWELKDRSSFEATLHDLGRHACEQFLKNPVGRSFLMMAGKSPQRLVEAMPTVYRTGWDHGWVSLQWVGPRSYVATLHDGLIPHPYLEGILQHVLEATGAVRPRVRPLPLSVSETEFALSWE